MRKLGIKFCFFIFIFTSTVTCTDNTQKKEAKEVEVLELKEYQGKKLSSIKDFRENSIKGPQYINKKDYRLKIGGIVANPKIYTYDEIIEHQTQKKVVTLNCVEGWSVTILWEGILLRELLEEAEVDSKAKVVILHAQDGYSTSFPLGYIMDNGIIIAFKMNDLILPPERGFPFQLVAENKWGYKWIKWITKIELSDNEDFRGYWESQGYSNDGDLGKSFIEER